MSLGNPFATNCPSCGQALSMMQMGIGHQCSAPDPRIMAELQRIHTKLYELIDGVNQLIKANGNTSR